MTASDGWNRYCGGTREWHTSFSRKLNIMAGFLAVLLISQLVACQQGFRKTMTARRQPNALRNSRISLLKALMVAGGYTSDPNFRPQKPIVRMLWDISTGKPARVAILISGGPYIDLKGMVALLGKGNHVAGVLKVKGCIAFLRTLRINNDRWRPDSVLLLSTDGWWPEANIKRYHLITLASGKLVETFSAKGNRWTAILGDPPMDWITSLTPVSIPTSPHFKCLCLFSRWFGASRGVSAKLWRWDPESLHFVPLTKREIGTINSAVLKWSRGVKW